MVRIPVIFKDRAEQIAITRTERKEMLRAINDLSFA
jgi:hypothetical protein